ncbi:MAG: gliding motility-associated C-terminal domain-containing protein [Saprospiraceae bacterium]|nr:gliding motility-associated C-terminal domain-containing protein [Saprospiraceae bacterium]
MKQLSLALTLWCFATGLFAQNLVISTQNPDGLYVCGNDQITITLQNGAGPAATNLNTIINFPAGITYLPGTVTGATESNISNLNAPVFTLADLAGGGSASFTLSVTASCALVDAINNQQLFSNTIVATYAGGSVQSISNLYPVETGFVNISNISPPATTATKGDVIMRSITLKNTRTGPIQSLRFTDAHFPGISISLEGGINQTNVPTLFSAEVPGSFFASVGNGDNFLDFNEEITLVEKVTIEDCGIPTFTNQSLIIIGWGCNNSSCQQDSISGLITILPTTQNPNLSFEPIYAAPTSQCGGIPAVQEILIINNGELPAVNVLVNPYTLDTAIHAIDQNSFQWNNGSGWQSLSAINSLPTVLNSCNNPNYSLDVLVSVPEILPGDTVRLQFSTYYCEPVCGGLLPRMRVGYNYFKACPPNVPVGSRFDMFPDTAFLNVRAGTIYNLENCLQDGETYSLKYWVKSGRLIQDTGYLQVQFEIPLGFDWDPDCPFTLDGQSPLSSGIVNNGDGSSTVRMVFDLPFSQDSVSSDFCLRYHCEQNMPCESDVANVPPRGLDYTVFPPPTDCGGCRLKLNALSMVSVTPNDPINCAITYCDEFILVVDNQCDTTGGGGGGGGGIGGGNNSLVLDFDSYRTNYGVQDNNDDRKADNLNLANAPGVRRDRFLVGDTLRTELRAFVSEGTVTGLNFRLFLESWLSDFDTLDGDEYDIGAGKLLFANYDTTSFVGAQIRIKTAGGQQYVCPLDLPQIRSDQHSSQVAEPNSRPPQIVDVGSNMFHQFNIGLDTLVCLPQGFALSEGDSLIFTADFKFENNFTPLGANSPPLINFRNSICDTDKTYSWKLSNFCTEKALGQFSGYLESIDPNAHRIEPCAQSTEISPFRYNMRIARANMFPFEVRRLSTVTQYTYSLPTSVALVESRLNYLRLQDNVQLFGVTPITPGFGGDSLSLNLTPFFTDLLDEGYNFEISTRFDTTCGYDGTQFGRTVLGLRYASKCFHDPEVFNYFIVNPNGYTSGSPELELFTQSNTVFLPSDDLQVDFFLRNNASVTAPNTWLSIETDGNLAGLQLLLMPSQTPVPQIGGVYQLGDLLSFGQPAFRLVGRNLSCRPATLTIRFGWDCDPVFNANNDACGSFVKTIALRPQPPELELVIINQPEDIPMCSPSAFFEFEVLNANDGTAFNIRPSIKLPPGIRIQPGSTQLSYPAGGAFVNMPDPVLLPGNVWQFDPEAASNTLAQNGLITADQSPLNALRIRFRVLAECGAVANAQPVYGAESVQACGINSNILRKPGEPIGIEGVEPGATANSNLQFATQPGLISCDDPERLTATIALNGSPMSGDSIYILLPEGTSYVPGSYSAGLNAPAGPPVVSGQQLQLPLPVTLGAGSVLTFGFDIQYLDPGSCADKFVILQTREKTEVFCPSSNQLCDIYVATGEALLNLNPQNPELQFSNFQLNQQGNQATFTAVVENAGVTTATNPLVQIYQDLNGNGQVDPGEPKITELTVNGALAPGAVAAVSGSLGNLPASAFCSLLALIPADPNCACADQVFPLNGNQVVTQGIGLCTLQDVNVGTPETAGSTYTWLTPNGLSCTSCANAVYTPGPEVTPGELVTLILEEKAGSCTIERRFEIQFGGDFGIETQNLSICEGEPATLEATPGGTAYSWTGPGISNANQQTQVVQPQNSANYSVTVTFSGGCTGTGTVAVTVFPADRITLPDLTTCEGVPVPILGQVTDEPGIYTLELVQANGCDSIITQELVVVPSNIEETEVFCEGGSTEVFDSVFTTSGRICRTETHPVTGCEVTTCVNVFEQANPQAPEQEEPLVINVGDSTVINTPDNYATYEWIPFDPEVLNCSDCPDPTASPDTSTTFILVVTDGNGCRDSVEYRVLVCDEERVFIPNAFTPNGDGSNDLFRVVPSEGAEVIRTLLVFNRWGQKVYEGSGNSAQWNGKIGDEPAPSDVYVWILDYECGGKSVRESGDVTLLR